MPAKLPDYYHEFSVTCKGVGRSVEAATASLEEDKDYILRWIRGSHTASEELSEAYNEELEMYVVKQTLIFTKGYPKSNESTD